MIFFIYPSPKGSEENQIAPMPEVESGFELSKHIDFMNDVPFNGIKNDFLFILSS